MQPDIDHQRNQVDLEFLQNTLSKNGLPSDVFQLDEPDNFYILTAALEGDCFLQLMYLPVGEIITETNLLQIFGIYSPHLEVSEEARQFVQLINSRSPLGQFSLTEDNQFFHRYIYALPRYAVPNEQVFMEVINLFATSLIRYSGVLSDLIYGRITLEAAQKAVTE